LLIIIHCFFSKEYFTRNIYKALRVIDVGDKLPKTLSYNRISRMKDVFKQINNLSKEKRRDLGIWEDDLTFAFEVCDTLLKRLDRESKRVSASAKRIAKQKAEKCLIENKGLNEL